MGMLPHLSTKIDVTCSCGEHFEAYSLGPMTRTKCNECTQKLRQEDEEKEQAVILATNQAMQQDRIAHACIPVSWKNVTFDNSDSKIHPAAFHACKNYAMQFTMSSPSLIIYSDVFGSGKTHLAACITNYLLHECHISIRFIKARDIMLELRQTFNHRGVNEGEVLNHLLGFNLLVIDDLGIDNPTDWLVSTFWTIFDKRLETGLPVVVTTNYSPEGVLGDRIGHGALSRLCGLCGDNIVKFNGKDLRRSKILAGRKE